MPAMSEYFFCGIGGSGMMPLAVLLHKNGHKISGSDRSYDQGKTPEKFQALLDLGITLHPQDGTGVTNTVIRLVVSSAVEESIPDVKAALEQNIDIIKRGTLLAEKFNEAKVKVAVAGTSGKSTVTGMMGTVLAALAYDPTVVNGGEVINFRIDGEERFSNIRIGKSDVYVAEMDESDGSIAHYTPTIALLNNIALDHKTMEELEQLFGDYISKASAHVVVNFDQPRVRELCAQRVSGQIIRYAIDHADVDLRAFNLKPQPHGIAFSVSYRDQQCDVLLAVPGRHNVENALAVIGGALALGLDLNSVAKAIAGFKGIHRRLEFLGTQSDVTVIDDFGHNPDKISASLETLKSFDGRLIVMFQPHGFGPLRMMGEEIVDAFTRHLDVGDILLMPEVYYAGGTVDRSVTAADIIQMLKDKGVQAHWFQSRDEIPCFIKKEVRPYDRVVIMGARDDMLHIFAQELLKSF